MSTAESQSFLTSRTLLLWFLNADTVKEIVVVWPLSYYVHKARCWIDFCEYNTLWVSNFFPSLLVHKLSSLFLYSFSSWVQKVTGSSSTHTYFLFLLWIEKLKAKKQRDLFYCHYSLLHFFLEEIKREAFTARRITDMALKEIEQVQSPLLHQQDE